ncbi:GNAT family N-acetyltransferase [Cohnella nanjingensis]|uniref:GNAT family N-acetyltransferase n=1 Tax=Cohnella nanjingensis TaxID=1387779 RepID=A0A7X0VGG3_9BACL|nr:GNAT family N-acetyltransferase [Cohnella nanjingensis]MBB6672821.1 GNAT family N-acetyltransferase [Cohnella nanjingensis]
MTIEIRQLQTEGQSEAWRAAFLRHAMYRPDDYYSRCLAENRSGSRVTLFALEEEEIAGCAHLLSHSEYGYFKEQGIPEINDLNVFPAYRRRGIANRLMEAFERHVSQTNDKIGIGVGLYRDYGSAQRIYCRRGYLPDGYGVAYQQQPVVPGTMVRLDDDLNLYLVKALRHDDRR